LNRWLGFLKPSPDDKNYQPKPQWDEKDRIEKRDAAIAIGGEQDKTDPASGQNIAKTVPKTPVF